MLRRLNEIVSNTADFINEGLNKNEYKKITKNIHLGVELELIHIYGEKKARSVNYQEYEDSVIEYALYDWAIRDYIVYEDMSSIDEYNEFIDSFMNFLSYANRLYEFLDMKRFIHWDGASNLEDLEEIVIDENDDFNSFKQNCDKCFERDYDIIHEIIESFYINVINALKQKENESKFFWSSVFNNLIDFQNRDIDVELNDRVFSDSQELKEFCLEEFNEINKNFYKILESIEDSYKRIESDIFKSVESRIIDAAKNYANLNYQPLFSEEQEQFIDLISDATKKLLDKYGKIEPSSDYSTWQVTTDTSISPDGYELISPIIPYNEFLKFIPKLCQSLDRDGFYANETTGFHIGVSLEDQIGKDIYDGLFDLYESKYNKLVAMIMTTAQGYQSTFRHVPDRMFNKYCMNIVSKLEKYYNLRLSDFSLEDLLYSDKFDDKIQGGKYTDLNTLKENYVEIRVLGGEEGFEILKNEQRLKYYLYDAISQAYKGITFVQSKEVIKVMKNLQRTGKNKTVYGISDKNIKIEWNKDKTEGILYVKGTPILKLEYRELEGFKGYHVKGIVKKLNMYSDLDPELITKKVINAIIQEVNEVVVIPLSKNQVIDFYEAGFRPLVINPKNEKQFIVLRKKSLIDTLKLYNDLGINQFKFSHKFGMYYGTQYFKGENK